MVKYISILQKYKLHMVDILECWLHY